MPAIHALSHIVNQILSFQVLKLCLCPVNRSNIPSDSKSCACNLFQLNLTLKLMFNQAPEVFGRYICLKFLMNLDKTFNNIVDIDQSQNIVQKVVFDSPPYMWDHYTNSANRKSVCGFIMVGEWISSLHRWRKKDFKDPLWGEGNGRETRRSPTVGTFCSS